jgi:ABC-type phosphate transport system ATPase subunit
MITKFRLKALNLSLAPDKPILKNIAFDIPTGQITTIIGPSGSGKSTLLRCLNRLWEPPPGSIFLDEVDITTIDVLTLRRRVGMLFQSAALFDGTVADNIGYGPQLRGETLSGERVNHLLTMAGLAAEFAERKAADLSGGEAQRVALARALANEPEVLLLDEPTSALDPAATLRVEETLLKLRDSIGLTVVWVSHAIEQVKRVGDEVILLVQGEIAESGTPAHLLDGDHHHLTEDFAAGKLKPS